MSKKGQAAMEFLMTYGWAILAAIVVIAVLAIYFRPGSLVQNSVIVNAPLYGVGTVITSTQIQVELKNNGAEDLTTTAASLDFNSPSTASCDPGAGFGAFTIGSAQILTFANCVNLAVGETVNADISVSYTRPGSTLTQQSTGSVSGKAS